MGSAFRNVDKFAGLDWRQSCHGQSFGLQKLRLSAGDGTRDPQSEIPPPCAGFGVTTRSKASVACRAVKALANGIDTSGNHPCGSQRGRERKKKRNQRSCPWDKVADETIDDEFVWTWRQIITQVVS
jgi:hypothetical protein